MHCPDSKKQNIKLPTLPQEIIDDILYRLPAKTIGRFRCVSKAWLAFLTQPHFILTNLKLTRKYPTQSQSLSLLSRSGSDVLYSAPVSNARHLFDKMNIPATKLIFPNHHDEWKGIIDSCDGLVLVLDYRSKLRIINPTTKAMRKVPRRPFSSGYYEPMYRLGYDEVDDDYKVIILSNYDAKKEGGVRYVGMLVGVFSVKSSVWRRLDTSHNPYEVDPYLGGFVFVNGCIHYMATKTADNSYVIVAFSLCNEKFYEVPFTRVLDRIEWVGLGILGGCLSMVLFCPDQDQTDVWVMKEYGVKESWIKLTIPCPRIGSYGPLCLLGEEQVVMQRSNFGKLVIYDIKKIETERYCGPWNSLGFTLWCDIL